MKKLVTFILPWVILALAFFLLFCLSEACKADVAIVNGFTNPVVVTGGVDVTLAPGQSFSFVPCSSATNGVTINGSSVGSLQDGLLYAVAGDGSVSTSAVLRSAYDDDSANAAYFGNGLILGAGIAGVLFGWYAVKKGLKLGDAWTD